MRFLGITGLIYENSEDNGKFMWDIRNFFSLSRKGGDYYESPEFSFNDTFWCLSLYSDGMVRYHPSGWMDLSLDRKDSGRPMTLQFKVGIEGAEGVKKKQKGEHKFSRYNSTFCFSEFLSRQVLKDHEFLLVPNGQLTISCSMTSVVTSNAISVSPYSRESYSSRTYDEGRRWNPSDRRQPLNNNDFSLSRESYSSRTYDDGRWNASDRRQSLNNNGVSFVEVRESRQFLSYHNQIGNITDWICPLDISQSLNKRDASIQTDEEFSDAKSLSKENHSLEKHGLEKVIEDMGRLLVSGENSDITVQVSDTQFKVHRAILSARSSVISAMFRHETTEKMSNKISIRDCEPDVFKEFLHYIYSGSVQLLTEQNVFGLYRIADKYLADDLKQQCLELIQDILCVQTFCETVKLSLTYEERDLLTLAINFASKNISLILCSVEWQNFIREYPTEANEILIKCFGPQTQTKTKSKCETRKQMKKNLSITF